MSKLAKKRLTGPLAALRPALNQSRRLVSYPRSIKLDPGSKQSRVIAMLQAPNGTSIAALMKVTGWQQHSVRGFLAGVVRKKLKLKLGSKTIDGNRIYKITGNGSGRSGSRQSNRPSS